MERIGVVGVGRMGLPIASSLKVAGFDVCVTDVDESRMRIAESSGLETVSSVAALAATCTVLLTVLPGVADVRDVILGDGRALSKLRAGSLWIDLTSNNDPATAASLAESAREHGIGAVGAPMEGSPKSAGEGSLRFFAAGDPESMERALPILGAVSRIGGVRVVGTRVEHGFAAKLIVNLLWFGQVAAVTEGLLLAQRLGVGPETMRDVLSGSAADSAFVRVHLPLLLEGDYMAHFGLSSCVDQLHTLRSLATTIGTPFALSREVVQLYDDALAAFGPIDGELLVGKLLEQLAGQELRA